MAKYEPRETDMYRTFLSVMLLAVSSLLVSCGGGGGGSQAGVSTEPATVGIVITDAHTDQWDKALVTVTSVKLISDGGHQEIFSGEKEVNLLALREHVKLLAVKKGVRPGYYSKIRLEIKEQQKGEHLLLIDEDATPPDEQWVKVPSSKVDLTPKEPFYIAPGAAMFVSLDWDMEKSLKLNETGSGKWIMRPVIFVHIGTKPLFKEGLVRLSGIVQSVGDLGFRLCSEPAATPTVTLDDDFCVNVLVKDNTGVFDEDGEPRDNRQVVVNEPVTVVGLLRRTEDDHDDYDDDDDEDYEHHSHSSPFSGEGYDDDDDRAKFLVSAIVVEAGKEGTWERVRGAVTQVVDGTTGQFDIRPDGDTTSLTAQLFDQSRIFRLTDDGKIEEVFDRSEIIAGDSAALDAVRLATGGPDLNVALMLTRPTATTETLTGVITSVSPIGTQIIIADPDDLTVTTCVTTDILTTRVYLLSDGSFDEISVTDLPEDGPAVVTGPRRKSGSDCLIADVIVASPPSASP